jgi:hypothetical protein
MGGCIAAAPELVQQQQRVVGGVFDDEYLQRNAHAHLASMRTAVLASAMPPLPIAHTRTAR